MVARHREDGRRAGRWDSQRAWGLSIIIVGLLLFTWPFVRTPHLPLGATYAHLLAAWLAVVVTLNAMARALGRPRRPGSGDA